MTIGTALRHRLVDMGHGEFFFAVFMTGETYLAAFKRSREQVIIGRTVVIVAGDTLPIGYRAVRVAAVEKPSFVALKTDTTYIALTLEVELHFGPVGIMAIEAVVLSGRMDHPLFKFGLCPLMADEAKLPSLADQLIPIT